MSTATCCQCVPLAIVPCCAPSTLCLPFTTNLSYLHFRVSLFLTLLPLQAHGGGKHSFVPPSHPIQTPGDGVRSWAEKKGFGVPHNTCAAPEGAGQHWHQTGKISSLEQCSFSHPTVLQLSSKAALPGSHCQAATASFTASELSHREQPAPGKSLSEQRPAESTARSCEQESASLASSSQQPAQMNQLEQVHSD